MQPTRHLITIAIIWAMVGFAASLWEPLAPIWLWGGGVAAVFILVDIVAGFLQKLPTVERTLPGRFAIGIEQMVPVKLHNPGAMSLRVQCYDGLPGDAVSGELPWTGRLPARGHAAVKYPVTISERGLKDFAPAHLRIFSPLRLWTRNCRSGENQTTRVYPNYEPVLRYALLAMANRAEQMGIVKKNRTGMSREFHQLRDYQLGDQLSKIDWKSTSKRLSLISRDYQEQRDQTVILAVDCGRRMRALDGGVPQFDHCLNAMLLLAYTALRQGDHVGIIGIGGSDRWLPPVKGVQSMTTILNHLYDYETSTSPSDFSEAAERLMTRQRRRALVVMLSNIRGEDGHQLIEPLRMIRRRHVTILANLQEESVTKRIETPAAALDDALEVGATAIYLEERAKVLGELRAHGIFTVDSLAKELPIALANAYLGAREMV
ncbi:membrane protein [Oceaniferula spumae]|uniref:Membrane protein n=1 Tax=Oceaniferula spumae TaxID=2979115 RepID=A0AAT9FIA4_9BACT